jgi:hypothetical protein
LDYAEESICSCLSMWNVTSEDFVADTLESGEEWVGNCWLVYNVGLDKFEFESKALFPISEPFFSPISINN